MKENRTLSRRSCNYMVSHAVLLLLSSISFLHFCFVWPWDCFLDIVAKDLFRLQFLISHLYCPRATSHFPILLCCQALCFPCWHWKLLSIFPDLTITCFSTEFSSHCRWPLSPLREGIVNVLVSLFCISRQSNCHLREPK